MDTRKFYVDGRWVDPDHRNDAAVVDPSTEQVCATISLGSDSDVNAAVAAARSALPHWSTTSPRHRADLLLSGYIARRDDIAEAMTLEMGAPVDFSRSAQWEAELVHIEKTLRVLASMRALGLSQVVQVTQTDTQNWVLCQANHLC